MKVSIVLKKVELWGAKEWYTNRLQNTGLLNLVSECTDRVKEAAIPLFPLL